MVQASWNVLAHVQKPDFVFRRNGRVHSNRRGRQFSRLLEAEVCASAVVMLDTPCSEVVWRVLATHSIRQFPPHSPPVHHRVPSHFNWRRGKGRGCHHVITATNFVFCRSQWPRCLRVRLLWSQKRHNTTVRTDSRQGGRNQKHYCLCQLLQWNRYDWNVISPDCLAPTNRVCFEPTVWSDTCSSTRRIRDWEQEALVQL